MRDFIYIEPNKTSSYIRGNKIYKGYCSVCGKHGKTTAHHLIPKRMHKECKNQAIKELRVRLCLSCENKMHPENRIITESEIIKRQNKNIDNLKQSIYWREMKINKYEGNFKTFKNKILVFGEKINGLSKSSEENFGYKGTIPGDATPKDYEIYKKSMKLNVIESNMKVFQDYLVNFAGEIEELFKIPNEEFQEKK